MNKTQHGLVFALVNYMAATIVCLAIALDDRRALIPAAAGGVMSILTAIAIYKVR